MKKAIIGDNQIVINVIECAAEFIITGVTLIDVPETGAAAGDTWNGTAFMNEERDAANATVLSEFVEGGIASLRLRRNTLISATDWRGLSDQTPSAAWLTYRQALRDLPANTVDPLNPTWPTEPGE